MIEKAILIKKLYYSFYSVEPIHLAGWQWLVLVCRADRLCSNDIQVTFPPLAMKNILNYTFSNLSEVKNLAKEIEPFFPGSLLLLRLSD